MQRALQRAMSDDLYGEKIATELQVDEVANFILFYFFFPVLRLYATHLVMIDLRYLYIT